MGRALTERPDLFGAVIDLVGVSNPLRQELSPNGPPNIPEFGSAQTPAGFQDLLAMDPYHHVQDGVKYPSVLMTTGINDPRVSSWEPAKMAARLQAATSSGNPVLLRVDYGRRPRHGLDQGAVRCGARRRVCVSVLAIGEVDSHISLAAHAARSVW